MLGKEAKDGAEDFLKADPRSRSCWKMHLIDDGIQALQNRRRAVAMFTLGPEVQWRYVECQWLKRKLLL